MMDVLPSVALLRALMMLFSVMESRLEVASSNTKMGEFLRMARAIATLCFSPPLSLRPLSPTWVSYPLGQSRMLTTNHKMSIIYEAFETDGNVIWALSPV